jgi:hypothetical protein
MREHIGPPFPYPGGSLIDNPKALLGGAQSNGLPGEPFRFCFMILRVFCGAIVRVVEKQPP